MFMRSTTGGRVEKMSHVHRDDPHAVPLKKVRFANKEDVIEPTTGPHSIALFSEDEVDAVEPSASSNSDNGSTTSTPPSSVEGPKPKIDVELQTDDAPLTDEGLKTGEKNAAPEMSSTMLKAQLIPWDVYTDRLTSASDSDCATISKSDTQIQLYLERLGRKVVITPAPTETFITVNRIYNCIRKLLKDQIPISSPLFTNQDPGVKRAMWESSRQRSHRGVGTALNYVQRIDFLLDKHFVTGIERQSGSGAWIVHFGESPSL
ncbi:hypothetical protein BDN70DRAFT_995876 [Pholiota conissans]|uniref:Uncharacterized protein n=1 Tax=Pholiota conissans TaxID=109636 RepID=A0A9P5YW07_9AGAR|nr:hypothetical protein BDN70DRAFT_995876 [Pholiota conissans]